MIGGRVNASKRSPILLELSRCMKLRQYPIINEPTATAPMPPKRYSSARYEDAVPNPRLLALEFRKTLRSPDHRWMPAAAVGVRPFTNPPQRYCQPYWEKRL